MSCEKHRGRTVARCLWCRLEEAQERLTAVETALTFAGDCTTTWPGDWGSHPSIAAIYAVISGWGEAWPSVLRDMRGLNERGKGGWSSEFAERLRRHCQAVEHTRRHRGAPDERPENPALDALLQDLREELEKMTQEILEKTRSRLYTGCSECDRLRDLLEEKEARGRDLAEALQDMTLLANMAWPTLQKQVNSNVEAKEWVFTYQKTVKKVEEKLANPLKIVRRR